MKTALIILNYNNFSDTIKCIESVEKYNTASIKYIIVDNGSTKDGVVRQLDFTLSSMFKDKYKRFEYESQDAPSLLPYVSFIVSKTNDGYAVGNNKGLKYAYSDSEIGHIIILNNDILFIADIIPQMINAIQTISDSAIVSPLLLKRDRKNIDYNCARSAPSFWQIIVPHLFFHKNVLGIVTKLKNKQYLLKNKPDLINEEQFPIEMPSGSCMLLNKDIMKSIGGFDPNTFLYFEENILCKKIKNIGKNNYILPHLKCIHLGASTTKKSLNSFILNNTIKSAYYYLNNYCSLSLIQKIIMRIAFFNSKMKLSLIKLCKR